MVRVRIACEVPDAALICLCLRVAELEKVLVEKGLGEDRQAPVAPRGVGGRAFIVAFGESGKLLRQARQDQICVVDPVSRRVIERKYIIHTCVFPIVKVVYLEADILSYVVVDLLHE